MATKTRVPIIAVTPVKGGPSTSMYTATEKQSLLDNFDLEVADRTSRFRDSLAATLESFLRRQETEMLRIPKDLRGMTFAQLSNKWGGSWKETMQRITKDRIDAREKEQEQEEAETRDKAMAEGDKGKRKRGTTHSVESTPIRGSKTARRAQTPANSRRPPVPSSASSTSRRTGQSRSKTSSATPLKPRAGPSSLPQNHVFDLPSTSYSIPTRSADGASSHDPASDPASASEVSEDEDDLPDAEAYEARVLAKSTSRSNRSQPSQKSGKSLRRAPSLHFRQSLDAVPAKPAPSPVEEEILRHVKLGDGRVVSFNPFRVDPDRLMAEIAEGGGLPEKEQVRVAGQIKEEIIKALTDQIGKWKVV